MNCNECRDDNSKYNYNSFDKKISNCVSDPCNGYSKLHDITKIKKIHVFNGASMANRMVPFSEGFKHNIIKKIKKNMDGLQILKELINTNSDHSIKYTIYINYFIYYDKYFNVVIKSNTPYGLIKSMFIKSVSEWNEYFNMFSQLYEKLEEYKKILWKMLNYYMDFNINEYMEYIKEKPDTLDNLEKYINDYRNQNKDHILLKIEKIIKCTEPYEKLKDESDDNIIDFIKKVNIITGKCLEENYKFGGFVNSSGVVVNDVTVYTKTPDFLCGMGMTTEYYLLRLVSESLEHLNVLVGHYLLSNYNNEHCRGYFIASVSVVSEKINIYGMYENILDSGTLTYKPIEYNIQFHQNIKHNHDHKNTVGAFRNISNTRDINYIYIGDIFPVEMFPLNKIVENPPNTKESFFNYQLCEELIKKKMMNTKINI